MRGGLVWRFSAGVVAAAAVMPSSATAQVAAAPSAIQPGQRIQEIDLVGDILYDSNVAESDAALAALRGIKPSDVIFEPSVRFDIARPIGRETIYLQGDAGYDFHARNSLLNRETIDVHPGVLSQIGICQTGLTGDYSRAQSDLSELAISPAGLRVPFREQNVLQVEQVGGNATCGRAVGFAPSVTASETWTHNSSPIERLIDAQTFSGSAGLAYQRPILGSVRVFGAFSQTNYPNRDGLVGVEGASVATGYQTVSGGVTYTRAVGSRLQGSASISYTKLDQQETGGRGFSGPTYSAALAYRVSSRLSATGTVSRATVPSNRLNSTFAIDNLYAGTLAYGLGSRWTLDGGASFAQNTYNGVPSPLEFDLTSEKIYTVFGDVKLRLTRRLTVGLNVQQLKRNANFAELSYLDTRVGLTARATF
jgi:hypothetical protein